MNNKLTQKGTTGLDIMLWLVVAALLTAGFAAHYYLVSVAGPYKIIGWIALLSATAGIAIQTQKGAEFLQTATLARNELLKVVWPTQQETMQTTMIVIVAVIIVGILLWAADTVLIRVVGFLTGQRG